MYVEPARPPAVTHRATERKEVRCQSNGKRLSFTAASPAVFSLHSLSLSLSLSVSSPSPTPHVVTRSLQCCRRFSFRPVRQSSPVRNYLRFARRSILLSKQLDGRLFLSVSRDWAAFFQGPGWRTNGRTDGRMTAVPLSRSHHQSAHPRSVPRWRTTKRCHDRVGHREQCQRQQ